MVHPAHAVHGVFYEQHALPRPRVDRCDGGGGVGFRAEAALPERPAAGHVADLHLSLDGCQGAVVYLEHAAFSGIVDKAEHVLVGGLQVTERQLLAAVVVAHRIGQQRPSVADVPPDDAGAVGPAAAPALHEELVRLRLHTLGSEDEVFQLLGDLSEDYAYLLGHQVVAAALDGIVIDAVGLGLPFVVPVPHLAAGPGIDVRGREHFLQRFEVGTAVIAYLAHELAGVRSIEIGLVVAPGAPEMVLRQQFVLAAGSHDGRTVVR